MNHTKTLRSYTIIPTDLYINRSADTQLQQTIVDMGRPGYILVARQMGKTNLLLNAKSTLSNYSDKFIYIDISNPFPDIRSFFQNIINTFFDSCPEIDIKTLELIEEQRKKTPSLPPHKEHENELRHIIRAIVGKLVICLDEIDALTKTNYSDEVFSFIRSIYFAGRANFSEFQRLTYVLSGVAEPSELIKDKAVSPFNIGEKIYLDDFSFSEFNTFVKKAKLKFDNEVIEHIYYWTNGNPRLSWDICARLEDFILNNQPITIEIVDSTIADMYLKSFDLPPIDHIRTLVEEDRLVRDAIMAIHYNKSETIADAMRSRLYLSGITKPDQSNNRKITIRNQLLIESLSEKWIQDIEKQKTPIYELANKKYDAGKYKEALELYDEYVASTNIQEDPVLLYFNIGNCHFKLGNYSDAINNFEKHPIKKEEYPKLFYWMQHVLGVSNLYSGNTVEGSKYFRKILEQNINTLPLYLYFDACLSLSSALAYDSINNLEEIKKLNLMIINSEDLVRNSTDEEHHANHLLTIAHYNLANIYKSINEVEFARSSLKSAIQISDERKQPLLAIEASDIAVNKEEKIQILKQCVQNICAKKIAVVEKIKEYPLDFTIDTCSKLIERLSENLINKELDNLILHLENKDINHVVTTVDILSQAIYTSLSKSSDSKSTVQLITKALYLPWNEESFENRRYLFTIGILLTPFLEAKPLIKKYWSEYIEQSESKLLAYDFRIVWGVFQGYFANKEYDLARNLTVQIRSLMERTWKKAPSESNSEHLREGSLLIDFLDLELNANMENNENFNVIENAKSLTDRLKSIKSLNLPFFPEDFLSQIRNRTKLIIVHNTDPIPTFRREGKKYGQNEKIKVKFLNGRVEEGKYKYFKDKLDSGECQVIEK